MLSSLVLAFSLAAPPAPVLTAAPFYAGEVCEGKDGALWLAVKGKGKKDDGVYEVITLVFESRDQEAEAKKLVGKHLHIIGREGFANGETFVLVSLMREVSRK